MLSNYLPIREIVAIFKKQQDACMHALQCVMHSTHGDLKLSQIARVFFSLSQFVFVIQVSNTRSLSFSPPFSHTNNIWSEILNALTHAHPYCAASAFSGCSQELIGNFMKLYTQDPQKYINKMDKDQMQGLHEFIPYTKISMPLRHL